MLKKDNNKDNLNPYEFILKSWHSVTNAIWVVNANNLIDGYQWIVQLRGGWRGVSVCAGEIALLHYDRNV